MSYEDLSPSIQSLVEMDVDGNLSAASVQKLTTKRKRLRNIIYSWVRKAKSQRIVPSKEEFLSISGQLVDVDRLLVDIYSPEDLDRCEQWDKKIQFIGDVIEGIIPISALPAAQPFTVTDIPVVPLTNGIDQPLGTSQTALLPVVQASSPYNVILTTLIADNPDGTQRLGGKPSKSKDGPAFHKQTRDEYIVYKGDSIYTCTLCKVDFNANNNYRHIKTKSHQENIISNCTGIPKDAQKWVNKYPFLKFKDDKLFCTKCGTFLSSSCKFLGAPKHLRSEVHKNGEKALIEHLQWLENTSKEEASKTIRDLFVARGIPLNVLNFQEFKDFITKCTGKIICTESNMRKQLKKSDNPETNGQNRKKRSRSVGRNGKGPKRVKKTKLQPDQFPESDNHFEWPKDEDML